MSSIAILCLAASGASAEVKELNDFNGQLQPQFSAVAKVMSMAAFLMGFAMGIAGLFRLKAHGVNPNDPSAKVSTALTMIFIGSAFIAIPEVIGIGVGSLFGTLQTGQTVNLKSNGAAANSAKGPFVKLGVANP